MTGLLRRWAAASAGARRPGGMVGLAEHLSEPSNIPKMRGISVNEYEASLVIKSGAELLLSASSDPRSDEGYTAVKTNVSQALELMAEALANFEAGVSGTNRSTGWVQDLRRVADDLADK